MGGAVSTGRNNDDLVDNLLAADYIRTPTVQKLFRSLDRADYFLPQCKKNAYKDLAWKSGNLHLSAPCIYSEVMEALCLRPNLSFLNLGSGTGYLSTMVGLALGNGGINHGIEIHEDVIEYATRKLEEFKRYSCAIDEYDLCEPKFIQGNCLCLSSGTLQYDRVYCGGACPTAFIDYMKNLVKVGGILVMPVEDQLMQIERTSETTWEERSLLPVSFATLTLPDPASLEFVNMVDMEPSSLQELCRTVVRNVLRNNINKEHPKLRLPPKRKKNSRSQHPLKRTLVPPLDTSDEDGEAGDNHRSSKTRGAERLSNGMQHRSIGAFIDIVLGQIPDTTRHSRLRSNNSASSTEPNVSSDNTEPQNKTDRQENTNNHDSESDVSNPQENEVHHLLNATHLDTVVPDLSTRVVDSIMEQPSQSSPDIREANSGNGGVIARIMFRKRGHRDEGIDEGEEDLEEECCTENVSSTSTNKAKSSEIPATKTKREKFDSGLGDEIISNSPESETTDGTEDSKNAMDIDSPSSSDEDEEKNPIEAPFEASFHSTDGTHWRTITVPTYAVDHLLGRQDDDLEDDAETVTTPQPVIGPYTILMRNKIQELPLPQTMKNYLNYYKEF